MNRNLGGVIAFTILASFSMTTFADDTQKQCLECGRTSLSSRESVGRWKTVSYFLPCLHGYTEGYDLKQECNVYIIKECISCGFTNKEIAGKSFRANCYGLGRPIYTSNPSDGEISLSLSEIAEADAQGEKLLEKHKVLSNQTIRFPNGLHIFETHGTTAIPSLREARNSFPNWTIPEKLGELQFADLTLYQAQTSVVYPDTVPPAKNITEVLTNKTAKTYYLCYNDGSNKFCIEVLPGLKTSGNAIPKPPEEFVPWEFHTGAYFSPAEEHSTELFQGLWISPELDGNSAFFIRKISASDCLKSEDIPFTIEEASSIYEGILKEFLKSPSK